MRAMNRLRRTAILAILAMAWAALLPFTAAARMLVSDGPVEHCHRLSIDSVIDPDPASPEGPSQPRKAQCPFCASAAVGAPPAPLPVPRFVAFDFGLEAIVYSAPARTGLEVEIPLSRGPPAAGRA